MPPFVPIKVILSTICANQSYPQGKRGSMILRESGSHKKQDKWVMGGIHMTKNSFVPTALLKVSCH